jgi:hydantoinase/carbamoylase family amidase
VPDGGRYDGALGVVGALAAVEALADRPLARTIGVVAFRDEEGWRFGHGLFGSRALAGWLRPDELDDEDADGVPVRAALAALGLPPPPAERTLPPLRAFLELHVEQGPVLAEQGAPLGVVSGVVGIAGLAVRFHGRRGHAGTIPMGQRADAGRAAARFVLSLGDRARGVRDAVATVGTIVVPDGASNVVPGLVQVSVDVRAPGQEAVDALVQAVHAAAGEAADREGCRAEVEPRWGEAPVAFDDDVMAALTMAARDAGVRAPKIPSGAGHDAAVMAAAGVPTGMLFASSLAGGVSHVPEEETDPEAIGLAVAALAGALDRLAAEGPG